ncbi:vacuolar protein-sorting-associated protein [Achlya hypogyna]|uniref:Vacuolar protein-sorting-associated protein 36 n=1 Tax=Achlya hypogyna TaxID=1202772 RepID=A0A1V9YIS6_ACHHY|nr:vacuolar protein-sorting-associated protein [Achlya hypogyna]
MSDETPPAAVLAVFAPLSLNEAGRPVLWPSEVEVYSQSHVTLYDQHVKTEYLHGRCVITTHRLLWLSEATGKNLYMPLAAVDRLGKEAGFITRSSKIKIDYTLEGVSKMLKLSFKMGGRDEFFNPLETSLCRRAWADTKSVSALADRRLQARHFDATQAGIGGIIQRRQEEQKQTSELTTQSFSDLNALMDKAKDMVGLIERYVATANSGAATDATADEATQMNALLLNMGIASPVTRENAGDAFHQQLARQLAEFLHAPMAQHGGIMTLSDVYCLFNRARGSALVSPDDLYTAAMLQKPLHLGLHVRKFDGGLIVLQADSHNEEHVAVRLEALARQAKDGCITSSDVAAALHISISLAREYLKVAEQRGKLCRDDTFEGLNFYPNRFAEFLIET